MPRGDSTVRSSSAIRRGAEPSPGARVARGLRDEVPIVLIGAALLTAVWVAELPFGSRRVELFRDWDHRLVHAEVAVAAVREHGEPPYWNPFPCGGLPLLAKPQSRVASPLFPLHLLWGPTIALRWELACHLFLAAVGAALLARRHAGGEPAARLAAAGVAGVVYAGSSFFALHWTEGHLWILAAAFLPWVVLLLEQGCARPSRAALAGVALALMFVGGGIPLPQTALFVGLLALAQAGLLRSLRPLGSLGLAGVVAALLSAPKGLPMWVLLRDHPRETFDSYLLPPAAVLHALVDRDQSFGRSFAWPYWRWVEQGHYVGWLALALAAFAVLRGGARERLLAVLALLFAVIAMGPLHPFAPWSLLHRLPVFDAQHVTARFLMLVVFAVALLAASGAVRLLSSLSSPGSRASLPAAALCVAVIALDVSSARFGILGILGSQPCSLEPWPASAPKGHPIVTLRRAPPGVGLCSTPGAVTHSALVPAARAGVAIIDAYDALCPRDERSVQIAVDAKDGGGERLRLRMARNTGRKPGLRGIDEPGYRGEAWLESGRGGVRLESRSFDAQTWRIDAEPGTVVVFNQNHDPGWSASRGRLFGDAWGRLALELDAPLHDVPVQLRYRPPHLVAGLALALVGIALVAGTWLRECSAASARSATRDSNGSC